MEKITITECPRDAIQGIHDFIPTNVKIDYINELLKVGFDILDFGSFVSPKAIPQWKDIEEIIDGLDVSSTNTQLLAIVANEKGAIQACNHSAIHYLGFPLSLSETFQQRNTNKSISEAFELVQIIQNLCEKSGKKQLVYLSMGFGNPYGDPYHTDFILNFVYQLQKIGIQYVTPSDTVGLADTNAIDHLFTILFKEFNQIQFSAHLHATKEKAYEKIAAAYNAGCRRFDTAIKGFGGCPLANDDLVGNIATESLLQFISDQKLDHSLNTAAFENSLTKADKIFIR